MSNEIAVRDKKYDLGKPAEMAKMAIALKKHVVGFGLYTEIQKRNYVHVEGWQFAGGLLGLYPRIVRVQDMSSGSEIKWLAEVEIVDIKTERIISRGFAVCSSKETKKKGFDEYAILSMAQTRAIGKASRNTLGWVMKLAGYEATPSEEMTRAGEPQASAPKTQTAPQENVDLVCHGVSKSGCGEDLTRQEYDYSKKIFGKPLCRKHQKEAKPLRK